VGKGSSGLEYHSALLRNRVWKEHGGKVLFLSTPDHESSAKVFLCLVCGEETICARNYQEITTLIDLDSERQEIYISVPPGGSIWVSGSKGDLPKTIRHNSFPEKLIVDQMVES
jgi:hypothetical protein